MASKSSKKTSQQTTTTTSMASSVVQSAHSTSSPASAAAAAAGMSTPAGSVNHGVGSSSSSSSQRPSSPLSPARFTRTQEKEALGHLNDRLAKYIEQVRMLESENRNLLVQVKTSEETSTREVTHVKSMYESELAEARRILDDTAKDKASLQINCGKFQTERDELAVKLTKKEKDFSVAEKNAAFYEGKTHDLQSRLNQAHNDKKKLEEENKELKAEVDSLGKQLASSRLHLEQETLARIDLENRAQSLKEDLNFKEQMHEKEITETRTRKQVEVSEIDGQLQVQYDQRLAEMLAELRNEYESQMKINREEIEVMYENKMRDLTRLNEQGSRSSSMIREELMQAKSHASAFDSKLNDLEVRNAGLHARVKDLEQMLEDERHQHLNVINNKETEISKLRDDMSNLMTDYQELMGIKIGLDVEIAAYHSLLQGEEYRLNISQGRDTPSGGRSSTGTPSGGGRAAKRRRTFMSDDSSNFSSKRKATGDVEICDQDTEGKFVKIHNKGETDINIGGWQLVRKAGEQTTIHKFHRSIIIKSGAYITVWSSDCEVTHSPPSDLVMKSQKWACGSHFDTHLIDNSGVDMASTETFRHVQSVSTIRSSSALEGFRLARGEVGYEELYHQQGDSQNQDKCVLM